MLDIATDEKTILPYTDGTRFFGRPVISFFFFFLPVEEGSQVSRREYDLRFAQEERGKELVKIDLCFYSVYQLLR